MVKIAKREKVVHHLQTYLEPQEEVIFGINQKLAEDLESLFL